MPTKKDLLKMNLNQEITGGLDSLIQSTVTPQIKTTPDKSKFNSDKAVHCNFVMDRAYHKSLKDIANNRGVNLKIVLAEAIEEYLANHKDEL